MPLPLLSHHRLCDSASGGSVVQRCAHAGRVKKVVSNDKLKAHDFLFLITHYEITNSQAHQKLQRTPAFH